MPRTFQWFTPSQVDYVYDYINRQAPEWFAGLVAVPTSYLRTSFTLFRSAPKVNGFWRKAVPGGKSAVKIAASSV